MVVQLLLLKILIALKVSTRITTGDVSYRVIHK